MICYSCTTKRTCIPTRCLETSPYWTQRVDCISSSLAQLCHSCCGQPHFPLLFSHGLHRCIFRSSAYSWWLQWRYKGRQQVHTAMPQNNLNSRLTLANLSVKLKTSSHWVMYAACPHYHLLSGKGLMNLELNVTPLSGSASHYNLQASCEWLKDCRVQLSLAKGKPMSNSERFSPLTNREPQVIKCP